MKRFFLVAVILFLTSSKVIAQDECLNFHVIHSEPLGYLNEEGKVVGEHVDIIHQIAKYSNLCITPILMPYPRIWQGLEMGKHDGGIVFKSQVRSHLVEYVAKLRTVSVAVVAKKILN